MRKFVCASFIVGLGIGGYAIDAKWIGVPDANDPALAKSFAVGKPVKSAVLKVTGVGYYEARVNGTKVGRKVLDPTPTDYTKRIYYSTFDVARMLREGGNEIRLLLGNGLFNIQSDAAWNFNKAPWRGPPRGIAELTIVFADGSRSVVATDATWRVVPSPVAFNDFREGEVIYAQAPEPDRARSAVELPSPGGLLVEAVHPAAEIVREYPVVKTEKLSDGSMLYDFGVNIAGWARITFNGLKKGDVVSIRYDERHPADKKGRHINVHVRQVASPGLCEIVDPKTAAFQTDRFISAGGDGEIYEPRFTYNGFRYIIVRGCTKAPEAKDVTACFIRTAFPKTGSFVCDNEIFNKLMAATELAYEGNFTDGFPTDCPHREKNGWLGDAATAMEFALYSYASDPNTATYRNWLQTIADQQQEDGRIPSIVPTSGWGVNEYSCGGGPAWGIAFVTIPYALYRFRGELDTMRALYPSMRRYAEKLITELNPLCRHGFGDWVAVKLNKRGDLFSCRTTPTYTSTAYAYRTLVEMAAMAKILGKSDDARYFGRRAEKLRDDFNKAYYKGNGVYENGFACGQAMALQFGLVPENEVMAVRCKLVEAVHAENDKIDFGLLGSTVVFRELAEMGETDLAWKMIMNESYPGFANWIVNGATTLWESWKGGSSRNHIMFGDFAAWAYAYIAGVKPIEPGYKRFEVQPRPPSALNHVKADIPTPNGIISVEWTKKDGKFNLSVVVPEGTTADVIMPSGERRQFMSGSHRLSCPRESGTRRKTVLLLGDSIRMGYAPYVRELMKDRADVVYPKRNCMFAYYTLRMIWEWSRLVDDPKSVDVVHFNNGLWDLGQRDGRDCLTPVDVYASTLRRTVDELRHFFPNARIIFATTTPINEKTFCEQHTKGNAEVERYNAAARKILSGSVDAINDLYVFVRENKVDRHYKDIVHFHDEGYRILAGQVVKSIDSFSTSAPMR